MAQPSAGRWSGTASMSFVDVLSCRQRPGPPVSVGGAHVLQNEHLTAAAMQTEETPAVNASADEKARQQNQKR